MYGSSKLNLTHGEDMVDLVEGQAKCRRGDDAEHRPRMASYSRDRFKEMPYAYSRGRWTARIRLLGKTQPHFHIAIMGEAHLRILQVSGHQAAAAVLLEGLLDMAAAEEGLQGPDLPGSQLEEQRLARLRA